MSNEEKKTKVDVFIDYLFELTERDDRAALADLRSGFREATEVRAWARIGEFCNLSSSRERNAFQTVGAGYATNPNNDDTDIANFGDVASKLSDEYNTFDLTFRRILSCKTQKEVCYNLRGPILASKAKDVPVPWKKLLWDLLQWESKSEKIKTNWAARYWRNSKKNVKTNDHIAVDNEENDE